MVANILTAQVYPDIRRNVIFWRKIYKKCKKVVKPTLYPPKNDVSNSGLNIESEKSVVIDKKTYELMEENSRLKDNMISEWERIHPD